MRHATGRPVAARCHSPPTPGAGKGAPYTTSEFADFLGWTKHLVQDALQACEAIEIRALFGDTGLELPPVRLFSWDSIGK